MYHVQSTLQKLTGYNYHPVGAPFPEQPLCYQTGCQVVKGPVVVLYAVCKLGNAREKLEEKVEGGACLIESWDQAEGEELELKFRKNYFAEKAQQGKLSSLNLQTSPYFSSGSNKGLEKKEK